MSIKELYKVKTDVEGLFKDDEIPGLDMVGNFANSMVNMVS